MPALDLSERSVPNTADETQGRHYQHRLPRIANTTFAGDEQHDGIKISQDRSQAPLGGVVAGTPLPVVDHSEESPSVITKHPGKFQWPLIRLIISLNNLRA